MGRLPTWLSMWVWLAAAGVGSAQLAGELRENAARGVLFLVPEALPDATAAALRDALLAQFATRDAELTIERETEAGDGLVERLARARARHATEGTAAVFWLRVEADDQWLLHMLDPADERVVVRRIDAAPDQLGAAVEAVAVMVVQSTDALLQASQAPPPADTEPEQAKLPPPSAPPPPPTTPSPEARPHRHELRLAAAYQGAEFSAENGWLGGVSLSASWLPRRWLLAGFGYVALPSIEVEGAVPFEVSRHPIEAHVGVLHEGLPPLLLTAELALSADLWLRHTPLRPGLAPQDDKSHWVFALTPRVRVELPLLPQLALHAGTGLDILLNHFEYFLEDRGPHVALDPSRLRLVVEVGITVYP